MCRYDAAKDRPESAGRIGEILDGEGLPFAAVYMEETVYKAGDEMGMLFLICPDEPDRTPEYFHFTDPRTGKAVEVPESGVLISRMFARKYRLDTGDRFLLYDSRGGEASGLPYTEANGLLGPHVEDGTALMDLLFQTGDRA